MKISDGAFFDHNIFIFCDGTWCGDDTNTRTNVKLLYEFIKYRCGADPQRCVYFPGVGLNGPRGELDYLTSGPFALDIKAKCVEVYEYIAQVFTSGDKLWLFGLSRGAYTVRRVAGMINNLGILRFDEGSLHDRCEVVFDMFVNASEEWRPNEPACKEFITSHCHHLNSDDPPVHFMGLFDTVGAEGVPTKLGQHYPYGFYDHYVSKVVKNVYQCAGIHDRLLFFQPCSIGRNPEKDFNGYHTQELWVPGCHYDVGRQHFKFGNGFWTHLLAKIPGRRQMPEILPNHLFADIALNWIVAKMIEEGFPSLDHWQVLECSESLSNPDKSDIRWDGDVYDKLLEYYDLSILKPWIVGDRLLPRDFCMARFVAPDVVEYPSKAVENHKFLYPGADSPLQVDVNDFHLPQRIPKIGPGIIERVGDTVGKMARFPIHAADQLATGTGNFLIGTVHRSLSHIGSIVEGIAKAPFGAWHNDTRS
jgi:hypothetical protein